MPVCSKFCSPVYTTCDQYVHPWTPSCYTASAGLLLQALQSSFRLYITVYVLALLMRGRKPTLKDIKRTILEIIQSTAFIGCHAVGFSLCACALRNLLGHYSFLTFAFVPTFVSSWFAILVERPSRRTMLSLYVTNIASETLYYMLLWRGVLKPVPYFDVLIFNVSVSWLLFLYRGLHDSRDSIFSLIKFIVGPYEHMQCDIEEQVPNIEAVTNVGDVAKKVPASSPFTKSYRTKRSSGSIYRFVSFLCHLHKKCSDKLKTIALSKVCPHPHGCLYYCLEGGARVFAVGYGLEVCMKVLMRLKNILKKPTILLRSMCTFQLGLFLGGFAFLYRLMSCCMRHWLQKDSQYIAIPAAFLAGFSYCCYRSNTVALYVMWKSLQILYTVGLENEVLPEVPCASIFFHCLSTAILFQAAIFEPQNLRPSYWKFLNSMSGGRIAAMDRECLKMYGLESKKMLETVIKKHTPNFKAQFFL